MHAYSLYPGCVKQNDEFAGSRFWPSFFVYVYLLCLILQLGWATLVIIGFDKLHGRFLLVSLCVLFPSLSLYGFVVTLFWVDNERRYPTMNVEIMTYIGSGLVCGAWNLAIISIHIFTHGDAYGLQPMESYSDSGTTYFFVVFAILTTSLIMLWNSAGMISGYNDNMYKPAKITLHDEFIKKVE